jgi:23S rRNA-/tRNA-specific pseudouridylate synthase
MAASGALVTLALVVVCSWSTPAPPRSSSLRSRRMEAAPAATAAPVALTPRAAGTMSAALADVPAVERRRAQLADLVRRGVFSAEQQERFLVAQPDFLQLAFETAFEDERFVLMNKPFDVRLDLGHEGVRAFAEEMTCADWLADVKGLERLRFCHQLDAATSGLLLAAKDRASAHAACRLFERRLARKQYLAIVFGHVAPRAPEAADGADGGGAGAGWVGAGRVIDAPIGPMPGSTFLQGVLPPAEGGKAATTALRVLRHGRLALRGAHEGKAVSLVALEPRSGRRHQLRVHCQLIGHPIVGDSAYAADLDSYRLFLHARRLRLAPLPVEGGALDVTCESADFARAMRDGVDVEPLDPAADGWLPLPAR